MPLRTWFESIAQDLRYSVRGFQRSPGPFWIGVMTVAPGAGSATAVFSVVDRILCLVAVQFGLSFVLLSGAGLLLQSVWKMQQVRLGMRPENAITVGIQLGLQSYPGAAQQAEFFERAAGRVSRLPGLPAVGLSDSVPLYGPSNSMIFSNIEIEGRAKPAEKRGTGGMTVFRTVTTGYFTALGIPMVRGRGFRSPFWAIPWPAAFSRTRILSDGGCGPVFRALGASSWESPAM